MKKLTAFELWRIASRSPVRMHVMKDQLQRLCPDNPLLNLWLENPRKGGLGELLHQAATYELAPLTQEILDDVATQGKVGPEAIERAARVELIKNLQRYTRR